MTIAFKKICMLGDFAVGKTSLVRRFVDRQFSDQYLSSVGVKISRKLIQLSANSASNEREVHLILWDLQGSAAFKSISPSYLKGSHGAIVVGDLTRQETLLHVKDHIDQFALINPKSPVIIALNKCDMSDAHEAATVFASGLPRQAIAMQHTSAKTGEGVDKLFETLGCSLIEVISDRPSA